MCVPCHNCPPPPRHLNTLSVSHQSLYRAEPYLYMSHRHGNMSMCMSMHMTRRHPRYTVWYIYIGAFMLTDSTPKKSDAACLCAMCRRTTSAFASREVMRSNKKSPRRGLA